MTRFRFRSALIVLFLCGAAVAQPTANAFDPATAPHVLQAVGSRSDHSAALGDRISVSVRNFSKLLDQKSYTQSKTRIEALYDDEKDYIEINAKHYQK